MRGADGQNPRGRGSAEDVSDCKLAEWDGRRRHLKCGLMDTCIDLLWRLFIAAVMPASRLFGTVMPAID